LRKRLDALAPDRRAYLVIEKILGSGEELPADWGVNGTTGYDFMNQVSALQHDPEDEPALTDYWAALSGRPADFETEELSAREEMLRTAFDRQLAAAAEAFHAIASGSPDTRDLTAAALHRGLIHIIRHLRVYRTYATGVEGSPPPGPDFDKAVAAALEEAPAEEWPIRFIAGTMSSGDARVAVKRFNQLTAPVAAKAVEDTAFYRYGRLLSRNDVGFQPAQFTWSPTDFHTAMTRRAEAWPHAMLTTATHDHKRGEDARARLAVISELTGEWQEAVEAWRGANAPLRPETIMPDDEYQLYQTLAGAWPLDLAVGNAGALDALRERVAGWRIKALREAKLRSSWAAPDEAYESANLAFLEAILDPAQSQRFLDLMQGFVARIAPAAAMNGLVQLVLRCTAPGMPDLYQGTEFWDFSLVDPDNRRRVDYPARIAALEGEPDWPDLARTWRDGRIKQRLAAHLLALRAADPGLFAEGGYHALPIEGARKNHVLAFSRHHGKHSAVVAMPIRCAAATAGTGSILPPGDWWEDTEVVTSHGRLPLSRMADIPVLIELA
jgi:(1->4)-alpha-D-glucan 1-alpha-D-glucosylmutase